MTSQLNTSKFADTILQYYVIESTLTVYISNPCFDC